MNWIGKWCSEYCRVGGDCDGCHRYCEPRYALTKVAQCSEYLIWMLINERGAITHPKIADALADYIGVTAEERDSIVHPMHRGTYIPRNKQTGAINALENKEDIPE